jgi:hypothetical protein
MKIFDCFTFNNELDMLELRLQEHWDQVDHFVISEANLTHNGAEKKPFVLYDNWDRFKDYHEKIIHIQVNDMPLDPDPWIREIFQRNTLARGLSTADPDDVIAISDCDELLRWETWHTMRDPNYNVWASAGYTSNFKFNYILSEPQAQNFYYIYNMAVRAKTQFTPQYIRNMRLSIMYAQTKVPYACVVNYGGWHFTFIGDTEFVRNKIMHSAHAEYSFISEFVDVEKSLSVNRGIDPTDFDESFATVKLDNYFPRSITSNLDRWKDYILPDDGCPNMGELITSIHRSQVSNSN